MELRKLVKADHVIRTRECIEALAKIRGISSAYACELFISWVATAQAKLYVLPPDSKFAQELNSVEQGEEFSSDELFEWLAVGIDELPAVLGFSLPEGMALKCVRDVEPDTDLLRAELAQARARIAELEAEREQLRIDHTAARDAPGDGHAVSLPHMTMGLSALIEVMHDHWGEYDAQNPPKSSVVAAAIDSAMRWSSQKDGSPSRTAQALAGMIRPDAIANADPRNARRRQ